MNLTKAILPLLLVLVGSMLSLVGWGIVRLGHRAGDDASLEADNRVLVGLLALGVLALSVFVAYLLLGLRA